jgi:hypothetical protein
MVEQLSDYQEGLVNSQNYSTRQYLRSSIIMNTKLLRERFEGKAYELYSVKWRSMYVCLFIPFYFIRERRKPPSGIEILLNL